ncbi:hypothetical protein [Leptolyngbya sp. FACHB-261]|uniref:hypothetical protein n=1 Tax=Leptolyngbya sp. FACHB-261 TaxID=2692806 RepID=UPI001682FEEF|nr:hypothetical protein [Leptolyngbya sp. FACHB-261]MBD2104933.1 hypothetical protein [Leptolyngbya sp. FACHB-261]
MTSNLNTSSPRTESRSGAQQASVPISVYRELASELQVTRTRLETLTRQNQELVRQNQRFRAEVETTVRACARLKQIADSLHSSEVEGESITARTASVADRLARSFVGESNSTAPEVSSPDGPIPEHEPLLYQEESQIAESLDLRAGTSDRAVKGWLPAVVLALVVLTFAVSTFGVSFFLLRPPSQPGR